MMKLISRRTLLSMFAVAAPVVRILLGRSEKVGLMTVERWFAEQRNEHGYSVLLDGRDITDGCVWFDDTTGQAEVLKRDSDGHFYSDSSGRNSTRQLLTGKIQVVQRA